MPKGKVLFQFELSIERELLGTLILLGGARPLDKCAKLGVRSVRVQDAVRRKQPKLFCLANVGNTDQLVGIGQMRCSRHLPYQKRKANRIMKPGPCEEFEAFVAFLKLF